MSARALAVRSRRASAAILALIVVAAAVAASLRPSRERADFVFTCGGELRTLDPHAATGIPEGRVIRALFEGLVVRDPVTLQPAPGCAASWQSSPDGRVYTFAIRPDARWSNGDALSAHDFVWSWRRLLEPATGAQYAQQLWCVEGAREFATGLDAAGAPVDRAAVELGVRALDDLTLEVRLAEPHPRFLDVLTFYAFVPLHRASLETLRESRPATWRVEWTRPELLVSNGPYRLVERRINERTSLEKSRRYWNADAVAMRTIDVLPIESWSSAVNLYLAGEIDWVDGAIPGFLVRELGAREDFHAAPYLGVYFYRLNTTRPPLDDARVRRALSRSLTRSEITSKVLKAGQAPSESFTPWGRIRDYVAPKAPPPDAAAAVAELVAAGYAAPRKPGAPFPKLEIHFNTSESHRAIAEVVAHQWKRVLGVETSLRNQESKSFLDAQSRLDYDVSRSSWIGDYVDPLNFLEIWTSDSPNNRTGWKHAQFDQLIALARSERDPKKRNAELAEAERILLHEAPCIPLYSYVSQNLLDPRVGGFDANLLNEPSLARLFWRDDAELDEARQAEKQPRKRVRSHGPRDGLHSPAVERLRTEQHADPEREATDDAPSAVQDS